MRASPIVAHESSAPLPLAGPLRFTPTAADCTVSAVSAVNAVGVMSAVSAVDAVIAVNTK